MSVLDPPPPPANTFPQQNQPGGRWVLAQVVDDSYTLEQFPQVSVQDCAAHPEDIEATTSKWMMQNASETALEGAMTVRCSYKYCHLDWSYC